MIEKIIGSVCREFNLDPIEVRNAIYKTKSQRKSLCMIAQDICSLHGITIRQLKSKSPKECYEFGKRRKGEYVKARADFSQVARWKYEYGIEQIGKYLEVDHTTVVHYTNHYKGAKPTKEMKEKQVKIKEAAKKIEKQEKKIIKFKETQPFVRPKAEYTNIQSNYYKELEVI